MSAGPGRRRDYPGWRMVWALSVTETVSYAALFSCFAVMVVPMREDLEAGGSLLGAGSVVGWSQARGLPQLYLAFVGIGPARPCSTSRPSRTSTRGSAGTGTRRC